MIREFRTNPLQWILVVFWVFMAVYATSQGRYYFATFCTVWLFILAISPIRGN